jgi:hypothetical protein
MQQYSGDLGMVQDGDNDRVIEMGWVYACQENDTEKVGKVWVCVQSESVHKSATSHFSTISILKFGFLP